MAARVLPGFRGTLGVTTTYLGLLVVLPLAVLVLRAAQVPWSKIAATLSSGRVLAALRLSVGASLVAALVNGVCGFVVAWVLVRYRFLGRRLVDALVDLPFALPTAVAGLALTAIYADNGLVGQYLVPHGLDVAYARPGVVLALTFVGLPFVVRAVQPVLEAIDPSVEEAAATLGASRLTILWRVVLPSVRPALLAGVGLSFARALGEYGSIVFISGNMPFRTEIVPLLIIGKLEQYDTGGATVLAVVMMAIALVVLVALNLAAPAPRHGGHR